MGAFGRFREGALVGSKHEAAVRRPTVVSQDRRGLLATTIVLVLLVQGVVPKAAEIPAGRSGYNSIVAPFFETHCIACHGPKKSKGKVTLHTLDGDLSAGRELERWELILEMLVSGEMPPEDEPQPDIDERKAVEKWIEAGLRDYVQNASQVATVPTTRRLTNFEYQNTMRDLLGFELNLIDNLPKDPSKPYKFNNTAEFMRMGPEQVDRYLENARRAMASAIVAPEAPEVHRTRREWEPRERDKGLKADEIAIQNSARGTPGTGMGLKSFPETGEFRIRVQASAVLPPGIAEMPMRLVMGYGLNVNSSTQRVAPVGTIRLHNKRSAPQIHEFRGRIENHPAQPGRMKGEKRQPDTLTITAQNLYDDGTLNDENRFLYWPRRTEMPRAVVNWIEFEAPITEVWPPEHHTRILFESSLPESDPKGYLSEVLERFISRAYRRPAKSEEVERFAKIFGLVRPDLGSFEAAMRETLAMVLVSPQFLYHTVTESGEASRQYELASKLSYFLWGSMPDDELIRLAAEARLDEPDTIGKQVRRLLADDRSRDFVGNFSVQWLSLAKMKTVPINRELFPRFLYYVEAGERAGTEKPYLPTIRDHMVEESVGFIAELIHRNASVLKIVDSDFAVLNQPLAAHYGVAGVQGHEFRPVTLKPEDRLGGLLTHGSVLVGNGTGSAPHPIYRAVWLREAILGDEVKPPPADVPALSDSAGESAEQALSIKDLLAKHRQKESCKDCHVRLDPWGIPFERYNAVGKYQASVPKEGVRVRGFDKKKDTDLRGYRNYLKSINTEVIEAESRVPHGPAVDGLEDLKAYLLKNRRNDIAENVLRRLLSYGIGRELTYRDRFEVEGLLALSRENGFGLRDMIVSICQSDLFRGKIEE